MLKYIEPLYFFIALFVGMFLTYILTPIPDIIIKYPTPENAGNIIYKDSADTCYKYKATEVNCPNDKSKIKSMEIQYVDNVKKNDQSLLSILKEKLGI